jgi:hypothetical protein
MKKKGTKYKIKHHIALNKEDNSLLLTSSYKSLAEFVGIHPLTLARHRKQSPIYDTTSFTIWINVPLEKMKRGFALK